MNFVYFVVHTALALAREVAGPFLESLGLRVLIEAGVRFISSANKTLPRTCQIPLTPFMVIL